MTKTRSFQNSGRVRIVSSCSAECWPMRLRTGSAEREKRTGPCNGATVARLRRASLRNVCSSAVPNRNGTPRDRAAAHRATRESRFCAAARVGTISLDCAPAPSRQARLPEGGRCIRPWLDTPPTQLRRKASLLSPRNLYVCFLSIGNRIRRTAHCSATNSQRTGRRKRSLKNGEAPRAKKERSLQAGHGRAARKATNRPGSRSPCEHDQGRDGFLPIPRLARIATCQGLA